MESKSKILFSLTFCFIFCIDHPLLSNNPDQPDSLCTHKIIRNSEGKILPWYKPDIDGAGYGHAIKLAAEFIKNEIPNDPETGLKLYYLFCEFKGPEYNKDFYKGTTGRWTLPHNPACVFAGFTEGLAVKYRVYSGDESYLEIVRGCLDHMLNHGTSPSTWKWGNCPYASSYPGKPEYTGSGFFGSGIGDGEYVLEPDKVGEMGVAYLQFYQITEDPIYLDAAINCANALANNITPGDYVKSPWPYRVHARTGVTIEQYCSNILPAIQLFDGLTAIKDYANINPENITNYQNAKKTAWDWFFSQTGPMKTYVWKGYHEDTRIDEINKNRVQITPLEVARYIIQHPENDSQYYFNVTTLIQWCKGVFGTNGQDGFNAQCEQLICFRPMGSSTSRYASVCAMWYEQTKDKWHKTEAFENFNWATYCTSKSGCVSVGPGWSSSWFSACYSDYIKHFIDGMAAIPEWAPTEEDHLLSSTSVVQTISYNPDKIRYRTYLPSSVEVLKLTTMPKQISADGKILKKINELNNDGWTWEKLENGGVLRIRHSEGRTIQINK